MNHIKSEFSLILTPIKRYLKINNILSKFLTYIYRNILIVFLNYELKLDLFSAPSLKICRLNDIYRDDCIKNSIQSYIPNLHVCAHDILEYYIKIVWYIFVIINNF